jgi:hypothetical protein
MMKKDDGTKKHRTVSFRLDDADYQTLERRARAERMSVSEYVRRKVLAAEPGFVWTNPTTTVPPAVGTTYTYWR